MTEPRCRIVLNAGINYGRHKRPAENKVDHLFFGDYWGRDARCSIGLRGAVALLQDRWSTELVLGTSR